MIIIIITHGCLVVNEFYIFYLHIFSFSYDFFFLCLIAYMLTSGISYVIVRAVIKRKPSPISGMRNLETMNFPNPTGGRLGEG
jgi:hypothetical protein